MRQRRRSCDRDDERTHGSKGEEGELKHHPKRRLPTPVPRRPIVAPIDALPPRRNTLHNLRDPLPYNPRLARPLHRLLNHEIGEDGADERHERGIVTLSGWEEDV